MEFTKNLWDDNKLMQAASLVNQDLPPSALYVVALPIGNLGDITLRALWILNKVDAIGAEDTRETKKLLERFSINVPTFSVHQHTERLGAEKIITLLHKGQRIALVTDAGTPAVSDPGSKVVREVMDAGLRVIPIPGASAVVAAISASGLSPEGFIFHGFLTGGANERKQIIKDLHQTGRTFVLYEAPHRIQKLALELAEVLPDQQRVVIARELTKKFETFETTTSERLTSWAKEHSPRGEYVVLVDASSQKTTTQIDSTTLSWLISMASLVPASKLAASAAKITGVPKEVIYQKLIELNQKTTLRSKK